MFEQTEGGNFMKCVAVGDGAVGKTCMLICYATNKFPTEYVPTVFDNYAVTVAVRDSHYQLGLFDTAGQEEYQSLRLLSYSNTDVFLVCFSVVMPESMKNVEQKWIPEIRHQEPRSRYILIGTQIDLRDNEVTRQKLQKRKLKPVTEEEGQKFAKKLRAEAYVECSSLTQQGLKDVFDECILAVLDPKTKRKSKRKISCALL